MAEKPPQKIDAEIISQEKSLVLRQPNELHRENEAKWEEDSKKNDALCSKHDLRLWLAYCICSDDYVLYMLYYRVSTVGMVL